jgi:SAM-dependent methyltransferase
MNSLNCAWTILATDPSHPHLEAYVERNEILKALPPSAMSSTSASKKSRPPSASSSSLSNILIRKSGRLFLRDSAAPYPLPCDLAEIHRQTLRSMVLMQIFDAPYCAPYFDDEPPTRVLEIACGSGAWSTACHDYLSLGTAVSFTGLDILPLAPDLSKSGLNWQFVQHDLQRQPLPFADGQFDFVFVKDTGLCTSAASLQAEPLSELLRVLKSGGTLEIWDSDYIIRTLLPNPSVAPGLSEEQLEQAEDTATYTISAATPFAQAQNEYLKDYNAWATKAFERRRLTGVPCAFIGMAFSAETESFRNYGSRRIAIPLGEFRWEKEPHVRKGSIGRTDSSGDACPKARALTPDQLAVRKTALNTVVQMIEGLESMLMEASGKSKDEWDRWWAGMVTDLLHNEGTASGECLEVGAWWGQKR